MTDTRTNLAPELNESSSPIYSETVNAEDRTTFDDKRAYKLNHKPKFPQDNTKFAVVASHIPAFEEIMRFVSLASIRFMAAMASGIILPDDYSIEEDPLLSSSTIIPDLIGNIDATIRITKPMLELFPGDTLRESFTSYLNTSRAYMVNCINQFAEQKLQTGKDVQWALKIIATGKNYKELDKFTDSQYPLDKFPFPLTTIRLGEWVNLSPYLLSENTEIEIDSSNHKAGVIKRDDIKDFYKKHVVFNKKVEESADRIRIETRASTYLTIVEEAKAAEKKMAELKDGEVPDFDTKTALERLELLRLDNTRRVREHILTQISEATDEREVEMIMEYLLSSDFQDHVVQRRELFLKKVRNEADDDEAAEQYMEMIDNAEEFIENVGEDYATV